MQLVASPRLPVAPPRCCGTRSRWGSMARAGASICLALAAASIATLVDARDAPRFELRGSGTLALDQPMQQGETVQLKAYLAPVETGIAARTSRSAPNERFVVAATLSPSSLVCYNDTIFRDEFDGTGL